MHIKVNVLQIALLRENAFLAESLREKFFAMEKFFFD